MTSERAATYVLMAWAGMVGLITLRQVIGGSKLPPPSAYLGSAVLFTLLWAGSLVAPSFAVTAAVGVDIAALASPYIKGSGVGLLDQAATWLEKVAPTPTAGGTK